MEKILHDRKILLTTILLQSLVLIAVFISWQPKNDAIQNTQVLAEIYEDPDREYKECLGKPVSERQACAAAIGQNLAASGISSEEKVQHCMKLRPVFYRYCLEELRQAP